MSYRMQRLSSSLFGHTEFEQSEYFLLIQTGRTVESSCAGEDQLGKFPSFTEHTVDPLLHGVRRDKPRHIDGAINADPVCPIDRLVFDRRIPPPVKQEHILDQ